MARLTVFWNTTEAELERREGDEWLPIQSGGDNPTLNHLKFSLSSDALPDDPPWTIPNITNVNTTTNTTNTTTSNVFVLGDTPDELLFLDQAPSGPLVVSTDTRVNYPSWPATLTENVVMPEGRSAVMHGPIDLNGYTLDLTSSTLTGL